MGSTSTASCGPVALTQGNAEERQPSLAHGGLPAPTRQGGGSPPAATPQSPVNLLARLEPAAIWSNGLFMEPGGGGPGPDPANLEAISSPGWGAFGVLISQSGPPQPPHPAPPGAKAVWGSPRSPLSCRALQLGPAPRPRALNTSSTARTGPHTGQDVGVGQREWGVGRHGTFPKKTSFGVAF